MVISKTSTSKTVRARRCQVLRAPLEPAPDPDPKRWVDVIDLGAPRSPAGRRARRPYTPNPRLYPGPQASAGARPRRRHPPAARPEPPPRRHRRAPCTLPSARLYRPPPPPLPPRRRPPPAPPSLAPRGAWPPPPSPRALDTASHAALRLAARRDPTLGLVTTQRRARSPSIPPPPPAWSRRPVVTLPAADDASECRLRPAPVDPPRLHSHSQDTDSDSSTLHPSVRRAGMAASPRPSASPEDRSDGNDPLSAPSEYLAEFLSAIMQRQYAEALKYCRLILQYEPHNATARGFYPLLRHKVGLARGRSARAPPRGSDSDDASRHSAGAGAAPPRDEEVMSHSADESGSEGSCASQSSLSLDSSERSGSGSRAAASASASHSASAGSSSSARWASDAASDEPDDNGNAPALPTLTLTPRPDDVENDNAGGGGGGGDHTARLKSESAASLRRLRAQFAREIK